MAAPTCNDLPLLHAVISEPLVGRWVADVQVDADEALTDPITLSFDGGTVVYVGAIHRASLYSGRWYGRIVGGTGGLSDTLDPKAYRAVPLSVALTDILSATGETLSSTSETLLSAIVAKWQRIQGTAAHAVAELADSLGYNWRILRDGTLWLGTETWAELEAEAVKVGDSPGLACRTYAPDAAPLIYPGVTYDGWNVSHVTTTLEGSIRQEVSGAAA